MVSATVTERPRFGTLLREYRLAAGLSQEALAEIATMSADGISALERGANKAPQRETLALLLDALQLDANQRRALKEAASRPSKPRKAADRRDRPRNLPRALTPLYGRESDIDAVKALVRTSPLVTLTGTGGVGKTRLSVEVAEQIADEFDDGVYFIDFAPIGDPDLIAHETAALFGALDCKDRPILQCLGDALRSKDILCVFDNCEHIVNHVAECAQTLILACPDLRIIASSREPLHVSGEQLFRVASLDREAAVSLFTDHATRASASFAVTVENRSTIERIVERLDGIALAIELAAARVQILSPEQIEQRLSERFRILSGGSQIHVRRHQTMRETLDWSYDLLQPEERRLFRALAVFAGSFSLEAAAFVGSDERTDEWRIIELLASLVDKSLVVTETFQSAQRYRLLESIRAYAREKADTENDVPHVHRRHAEYYTDFAEAASENLCTAPSTVAWAESLAPRMDNFRAALDWTINASGDPLLGVRLLTSLQEFWVTHGGAMEALRYAQRALPVAGDLPHELQGALWLTIARMHHEYHMNAQEMLDAAERACELFAPLGETRNFATALRERGTALQRFSRLKEAEADLQRALAIYRDIGDLRMAARTLGSIGYLRQVQGEFEEARDIMLAMQHLSAEIGDERGISTGDVNLAEISFALGDVENAIRIARRLLSEDHTFINNAELRATQESNLSAYLFAAGRLNEARSMALRAMHHADVGYSAVPMQHLAAVIASTQPKRAARLLGYVDQALAQSTFARERTEQYTYESLVRTLHDLLSVEDTERLQREGAAMNREQATMLALRR